MKSFSRALLVLACTLAPALAEEQPKSPADIPLDRPAFKAFAPSQGSSAFIEQFVDTDLGRFSPSKATKEDKSETFSYVGQWQVQEPTVYPGLVGDLALVATSKAAHHAISAPLATPLDPASDDVVVSYEVKLQNGLECGGAYIKLLTESSSGIQAEEFSDKTPYSIMFGPDKCGSTNKVHLILRYKSPQDGSIEEKHLKSPPTPKSDKVTNLYTLHLNHKDQTYTIYINDVSAKSGSLLEDFTPSFIPEKEIDDPADFKPDTWVDSAKITDPDATKPSDWDEDAPLEIPDEDARKPEGWLEDEPATIPDPEAEKPEEWDDEEDGDWIAPSIPNPKCVDAAGCGPWIRPMKSNPAYKGKWYAPLIDNPLYKGVWKAAKIANPAYFSDDAPLSNIGQIGAVGFEIWSMQSDLTFDNIFIGNSLTEARDFAKQTYHIKKPIEEAAEKAAAPKESIKAKTGLPEFRKDPIGFVRSTALDFFMLFKEDPVYALKTQPQSAAVVGGLAITLVGMLGVLLSLLAPKAKPAARKVQKKASEVSDVTKEKAEAVSSAVQEKAADLKKRSAKGKEAATE